MKKFRYEFDRCAKYVCPLRQRWPSEDLCGHSTIPCTGELDNRPKWCPLVEVKDEQTTESN
jgi:hypothetical protein